MIFVWDFWWYWTVWFILEVFQFLWFKCLAFFVFFFHKRDDRREWKKNHSYPNDLKMISFILTEVINVSHSPLRHELLVSFRIKCQKRCYIRNFVWLSLRYCSHSILMNSFLIQIGTLQMMLVYELQIGRKGQTNYCIIFCGIFFSGT